MPLFLKCAAVKHIPPVHFLPRNPYFKNIKSTFLTLSVLKIHKIMLSFNLVKTSLKNMTTRINDFLW
jgi:hypothetical protein